MSDTTQLSDQFLYHSSLEQDRVVAVSKSKRVVNVVDNNQGSYTSPLITIDATNQLNGSQGFGSLRDAYLQIPYVVSLQNTGNTALTTAANRLSLGLKCGVWNVIDSLAVELNGKQIISMLDYKMFWNNLRAQTEWTESSILKHGADAYLYPDDWHSMNWGGTAGVAAASTNGDGFFNNYVNNAATENTGGSIASLGYNSGFTKRLVANPPQVGVNTYNYPTLQSASAATIAQQHGRGAFVAGVASSAQTGTTNAGVWYYMLKIRLVDLHPIFKELDLTANPQLRLTFRVNAGFSNITINTDRTMNLKSTTMTSGQICPVMVSPATISTDPNYGVFNGIAAGTTLQVAFGPLQNAITPISLSAPYFPFSTTRLSIPFYDIANPTALVQKPLKTVRYLDAFAQYFKQRAGLGITVNSQQNAAFNFQLSASLKNVKYIALLPFAETSSGHYVAASLVEQFASPFDSAPWTVQAGSSIRSFQVQIGNQNVFSKAHDYDWENHFDELCKLSAINGDCDTSISNGLLDFQKWSNTQRVLIADCSRITNKDVPASIQVSGINGSNQGVNLLVIAVYERELTIDRLTGEITETD